jgi:hydroxyacid-oxoacid transhydrogenase
MINDRAFEMAASNIRFGPGITAEVGMDLTDLGARRALVLCDPGLVELPQLAVVRKSLESESIDYALYDRVRVEPSDSSMKDAISYARGEGNFDAIVALGGGSTIDTAKAVNLYTTYPADFLDYVNPPIGKGKPVPGPLKPLIAIPTTAGTGSETTGVSIFDFVELHAKTGIAHRRLKPTLGLVDPDNTRTLPAPVAASTGLDVLSHAIESYTAVPFNSRPRPERPILRPSYQGSNPISDIWALESLRMVRESLVRAVENPDDDTARGQMLLAAAYAGIGFGNAGVHLPHGMSYPVSGMVRDYRPDGYQVTHIPHAIIPHGTSVILNAPAAFRFTAPACPDRHLRAAEVLGADIGGVSDDDAGEILASQIIEIMKRLDLPNGLGDIGYSKDDIPALVEGTLPQHRVTKISPRPAEADDFARMFADAMSYW